MENNPILTFDTTGINRLVDSPEREALIKGLAAGYSLRLTFTNVDEVAQNSDGERRARLLHVCKQLLQHGDCLIPIGELLRKLILTFENAPATFEWSRVDVRLTEAVEQVFLRADVTDVLSETVRQESAACKKKFDQIYMEAKPAFESVFEASPSARRINVAELIGGLQHGGQYWRIARSLYDQLAGHNSNEETVRKFWGCSPPFQCVIAALCAAHYDRNVRLPNEPGSIRAGWADTFMAACLPYCDQFVTADKRQLACYGEVAQLHIPGLVLRSWCEFRGALCWR